MGSAAVTGHFSVQCQIEAQSEYEAGTPITINGTLHNSGASAIWVLSWYTFLEADWRDCLSVKHDGSPVSYMGVAAARSAAKKEAFFRLGPGESRSRQIDIGDRYDLVEPGNYQVFFRMTLMAAPEVTAGHWPEDKAAYQPMPVESETVSFRMTGVSLAPRVARLDAPMRADVAAAAGETPLVKTCKDPSFGNMTADQSAAYLRAHRWAYKAINEGITNAQQGNTWEYKRWMEDMFLQRSGREERHRKVIANLNTMAKWMETASIHYEFAPESSNCRDNDWDAWTVAGKRGTIGLCGRTMNDHWLRFWYLHSAEWARALLLVHEIAHAAAGVIDHGPAWPTACHAFAVTSPWLSVENAHNYALLAMGVTSGPPADSPVDNGIWTSHAVPGGWSISHSPAAAVIAENAIMTAYTEAPWQGGRLCYRMLHLEGGNENWKNPAMIHSAGGSAIHPNATPAVAVAADQNWFGSLGDKVFCAWVDDSYTLWSVAADQANAARTRDWSTLPWETPEQVSSHADREKGPALMAFNGGLSTGLYCVYVTSTDELRCAVKLHLGTAGFGPWTDVPFDKPRNSRVAPALTLFNRELRCAYAAFPDGRNAYEPVILTYRPAVGGFRDLPQPGTWHEDASSPGFSTSTIALTQWNSSEGSQLVALGVGYPDGHLRYAVAKNGTEWLPEGRLQTLVSLSGPTLVSSGSTTYAFFRRSDQTVEAMSAG